MSAISGVWQTGSGKLLQPSLWCWSHQSMSRVLRPTVIEGYRETGQSSEEGYHDGWGPRACDLYIQVEGPARV